MKKHFLFAAVAFAALAGCSKSVQTDSEQPLVDPLEDGTPVAVSFSAASPKTVEVKSVGAVETAWNKQQLYIYGFETNVTDFTTTPFINNVAATAPESGLKGAIDVINPATDESGAPISEPFYYVAGKYYDFYGYHIDDANTADPTATADAITIPFTIDGSQDILLAKADQATDIAAAVADGKCTTFPAKYAYSAYAARREVQPTLKFQHQLARFTFHIVAGSPEGADTYVDKITVNSKTSGDLVVVGANRGITNVAEETADLALKEYSSDEGATKDLTAVKPDAYSADEPTYKKIGESIMVIPGETQYTLKIYTHMDGVQTPIDPQEAVLDIAKITSTLAPAQTAFTAGYSYKVKIVVYGLEKVEITAELEEWKDGGETVVDPDDLPLE